MGLAVLLRDSVHEEGCSLGGRFPVPLALLRNKVHEEGRSLRGISPVHSPSLVRRRILFRAPEAKGWRSN